jgi:hypothetical protein
MFAYKVVQNWGLESYFCDQSNQYCWKQIKAALKNYSRGGGGEAKIPTKLEPFRLKTSYFMRQLIGIDRIVQGIDSQNFLR